MRHALFILAGSLYRDCRNTYDRQPDLDKLQAAVEQETGSLDLTSIWLEYTDRTNISAIVKRLRAQGCIVRAGRFDPSAPPGLRGEEAVVTDLAFEVFREIAHGVATHIHIAASGFLIKPLLDVLHKNRQPFTLWTLPRMEALYDKAYNIKPFIGRNYLLEEAPKPGVRPADLPWLEL